MTYGIRITNENSDLVIDSDFRNHAVVANGSATTSNVTGFGYFNRTVKVSLATPIALTRSPLIWGRIGVDNAWCGLLGLEINASAELTGFWLGSDLNFNLISPNRTIEWRVTAAPTTGSGATWGMEIFDSAGNRVFDSGLTYVDIWHVTNSILITDSGTTFTYSSITNPWYCLSSISILGTFSSAGDDTVWEAGMVTRLSDTQSRVAKMMYGYAAGETIYSGIGSGNVQQRLVIGR